MNQVSTKEEFVSKPAIAACHKLRACKNKLSCFYYKVIQRFRVTGLFAGQHTTKLHTIVGSALLRD